MKKFALCALLFITSSIPAFGLLPPLAEAIVEIKAILNSPELTKNLSSGEVFDAITKTDTGFLIVTNRSRLAVDVIYQPTGIPGPAKFSLKFRPLKGIDSQVSD